MRRLMRLPGLVVFLSFGLFLAFFPHAWASSTHLPLQHGTHALQRVGAGVAGRGLSPLPHEGSRVVDRASASVTMRLNVGYDDEYRNGAWLPVRVTLTNHTSTSLSGMVEIPNVQDQNSLDQSPAYSTTYQTALILPPDESKLVTLYIPALGVANKVVVQFSSGGRILAKRSDFPTAFGDSDFTLGVLTRDPTSALWLKRTSWGPMTTDTVFLTPSLIDRLPQALATFDVIALTNADTSQLTSAQVRSLRRYVERGGSVLLVGGPDWQQTLGPVATDLVPGSLAGSRPLADFSSLEQLGAGAPPRGQQSSVVSVLRRPKGRILAAAAGTPLVVRWSLGLGAIEYLAFDPSLAPFPAWHGGREMLSHLIALAAPAAASRTGLPYGTAPAPLAAASVAGSIDMSGELSNVSTAALPSLVLFVILTALYLVLLGPINFFLLFRLRKRELSWITIPFLAALYVIFTVFVAVHLKGRTVLLNTIGVVNLNGDSVDRPATLFVGLFAPVRGDYDIAYKGASAAAPLAQSSSVSVAGQTPAPPGLQIEEGPQTALRFLSMSMWSMRDATLDGSARVPGAVVSGLHPDAAGDLVGTIHNGLAFTLEHPAILAGTSVTHLPNILPGHSVWVRVKPAVDTFDSASTVWQKVYGNPRLTTSWSSSQGGIPFFSPPTPGPVTTVLNTGLCCAGPPPAPERSLNDRIRNVASQLLQAEASAVSTGAVELLAWSDRPLVPLTVDGTNPQRRDLSLILSPLSLHVQRGSFRLRPGSVGPRLVDELPSPPTSCCNLEPSGVYLGPGGFATFELDLPQGGHVRYRTLHLTVNTGGADGTRIGQIYEWLSGHWVYVDLSTGAATLRNPARFLSPDGAFLLRLTPTEESGDITIDDPTQDVQISGDGVAS